MKLEEIDDRPTSISMESLRDWSGLPKDVLILTLECLNSGVYHLLLRAVCVAWRSSLPLSGLTLQALQLPPISEKIFFHISPFDHAINCTKSGWIIQVEDVGPNRWSFFHPITGEKLLIHPEEHPNSMNLLDYRITEISRSFSQRWPSDSRVRKVVCSSSHLESPVLMALSQDDGKLAFYRQGFEGWVSDDVDWPNLAFKDTIYYNGRFYAVDAEGILVKINPSNWRERAALVVLRPIIELVVGDCLNYLIVSQGSLYLVNVRYVVTWDQIAVYRLREEGGESEWVRVKSIGDEVFFIGQDASFALSSAYVGSNNDGNHIVLGYLPVESNDAIAGIYGLNSAGVVAVLVEEMWPDECLFWPPPKWVVPDSVECPLAKSYHLFGLMIPRKIWLQLANGLTMDVD